MVRPHPSRDGAASEMGHPTLARRTLRLAGMVRRAVVGALRHDGLNLAQSAAYSAILALFPAMIVTAAVIALLPDVNALKLEVGGFFAQVLPGDVLPLLAGYFAGTPHSPQTVRALVGAALVSVTGASSVLATLMEGLRRAENLPMECWTFWQRRGRALMLVPISLLPLGAATGLVVFGRVIALWLAQDLPARVRPAFFAGALAARWTVALAGVVGVTAALYHLGTPNERRWVRALPGAVVATGMWFVLTLGFGWYVTRLANYSQVYGSLGAGIALLVWLYLVFLSVLCGGEFNVEFGRGAGRSNPKSRQ